MAPFLGLSLIASIALVVHLHGDLDHARVLGAWSRPLEVASLLACAAIVLALVWRARGKGGGSQPWRLGAYLAGAAYFSSLLHPYEQGASYYTLVITLGVFALLWTFGRALPGRRAAEVVALNLLLVLGGAEVGLRICARFSRSPLFSRAASDAADQLARNRCPPGHLRFGFPCNHAGEYDVEPARRPPSGCLVTAIGDSFSAGVVHHQYHFTTVAERVLGCEVQNIGVPQIGPEEYLLLLKEEAVALDPQVIVIDLFVGNDIVENLRGRDAFRDAMRRQLDRDNLLVYSVPARLLRVQRERHEAATAVGEPAGEGAAQPLDGALALTAFPWLRDPAREPPSFSVAAFHEIELRRAREICTAHAESAASYQRLWSLLAKMRQAAAGRPLLVMLIPDELQVEDPLWEELRPLLPADAERERPQRILRQKLDEMGIAALDLLPLLRAVAIGPDGRRHLYHLRDTHFNARGNEQAGLALARALAPYLEGKR